MRLKSSFLILAAVAALTLPQKRVDAAAMGMATGDVTITLLGGSSSSGGPLLNADLFNIIVDGGLAFTTSTLPTTFDSTGDGTASATTTATPAGTLMAPSGAINLTTSATANTTDNGTASALSTASADITIASLGDIFARFNVDHSLNASSSADDAGDAASASTTFQATAQQFDANGDPVGDLLELLTLSDSDPGGSTTFEVFAPASATGGGLSISFNVLTSQATASSESDMQPPGGIVPEPASAAVWGAMLLIGGVGAARRRRRKK